MNDDELDEPDEETVFYVAAPVDDNPALSATEASRLPAHPPWCHRDACSVGPNDSGTHNSKPVELRAERPGTLGIAVALTQSTPMRGYPSSGALLVDPTFTDTNDDYDFGTLPLDVGLARSLGRVLSGTPASIPLLGNPTKLNLYTGTKLRWMNRGI